MELLGDRAELITEPALGVVGIGEEGGRGYGYYLSALVMAVEDGGGSEPTAFREDEVGCYLQLSLGRCILEKKGRSPYMRAKAIPERM